MRKLKITVSLLFLWILLVSCAGQFGRSPVEIYTGTRAAFNNYLSLYLDHRDRMAPGPDLDALRAKIEPLIEKGSKALDAWGEIVGSSDDYVKERAFISIFDMIIFELIERGIY